MNDQVETIEARLQSFIGQLKSELGVLDRIIHKNKNQHRRSSYFQYLLKVRRDCKLLQSTNLGELVNSAFLVINGNRPKQKVQLLESLKRRKCDGGKHNFLMQLQGAARLLSQMVEPMLKAAMYPMFQVHIECNGGGTEGVREMDCNIEISTLLARTFFMGFSMTVLALLARLRVLSQQILLDVVSVFNMVSSLSHKQQSIKLNQEGIEVFREYYPTKEPIVFLECVWETDKFILLERNSEPENVNLETINNDATCQGLSTVEYQSIETILGNNKQVAVNVDKTSVDPAINMTDNLSSVEGLTNNCKQLEEQNNVQDYSGIMCPPLKNLKPEQSTCSGLLGHQDSPKLEPEVKKKVAFISVKRPEPLKANDTGLQVKPIDNVNGEKVDPFFNLLTTGSQKDGLL